MAFTESQKLKIGRILGVEQPTLEYYLTLNSNSITATVETDVATELTRWTTAGAKFVKIEPKESNKGVRLDSNSEQADIRRNIAVMLCMTDMLGMNSGSQVQLVRG